DRDQRQPDPRGGELRTVDDLAAAEADDRVVAAGLHGVREVDGVVDGAAADLEPVRVGQLGREALAQPGARSAADGEGELPLRGDPPVGQQVRQAVQGAGADVDDDGGRDETGQYRHAISRPFARSSWSSISTQSTSPM